jgi:PAS domain S-box-containing protein
VHPDDLRLWSEHRLEARGDLKSKNLVFRILHVDGTIRWIEHVCQPVTDETGTCLGRRGSNRDITERKLTETELRRQFLFLQQLLDAIPIPVFYKDTAGLYLGCNSTFETFMGLEKNQIVGKSVYDLAPETLADSYHVADAALYARPGVQVYENSILHADGTMHDVIFNKATYVDAEGNTAGIVGAITDVTQRKQAEEERKKLETQLLQAQKMEAIGQLAGGIAHDFNNILTAIIGYAQLLIIRMEKSSPLRHYIEQVFTSAERAADLTKDLLAFSRKQVLHTQLLDLCDVLGRVQKMLERLIPEDIEFRTTVTENELTVMADRGQIEQVLMNLVTNARDAMPQGGILSVDVAPVVMDGQFVHAHGFGEPGEYACISVTDSGHGMDEETQRKIFEPFFTTKEVGKGTGLGMAIIYGIVKQHNGYISVYSEPERGTTFRIYLPLVAGETAKILEAQEAEPIAGGTETILLVEDDGSVRELHKMILEAAGYEVIEAFDGQDALDRFMMHPAAVDILITDVIMPKTDGKRLYQEIEKVRPGMKALFMSGYTKDVVIERGILDDELNFLEKPVRSSELLRMVRHILDR